MDDYAKKHLLYHMKEAGWLEPEKANTLRSELEEAQEYKRLAEWDIDFTDAAHGITLEVAQALAIENDELRQALEKIRGLGVNDTVQDAVYIARNALKGGGE